MKSITYFLLFALFLVPVFTPRVVEASWSFLFGLSSCVDALANCQQSKVTCENKLQNSWHDCNNKYDAARTRCETYKTKAESFSPACQQKLTNCQAKARLAKDSVTALARCQNTYDVCQQKATVSQASYLNRYDQCKDKAKIKKDTCEQTFTYTYPKKVANCLRRADSCIKSVSRRCGG
jgi:hypothetical protein